MTTPPTKALHGVSQRGSLMETLEAGLGAMAELHHLLKGGGVDVLGDFSRALSERHQTSVTGLAVSRITPSAIWSIPLVAAPESLTLTLEGHALRVSLDEPVEWLALSLPGALTAGARRAIVHRSMYNAAESGPGLVLHYFGRNYAASGSFADTLPTVVHVNNRNEEFDCVVLQEADSARDGDLLLYWPTPPAELVLDALRVIII